MKGRLILSALLKSRNIGTGVIIGGLLLLLTNPGVMAFTSIFDFIPKPAVFSAGILIYLLMVIQTLSSKKFHEEFKNGEKTREIQNLNNECSKLARKAIKNTNTNYSRKLKKIIGDKNDIYSAYLKDKDSYLKTKITEQTLNLIRSYIKLLDNFCIRNRELANNHSETILNRININTRKAEFTRDHKMAAELKKVIDVDKRRLERRHSEERELERIGAKLDYMEGTVNMFKHQILANIESDDMLEDLEKVVNEAEALDTVLEDWRKNKRKA